MSSPAKATRSRARQAPDASPSPAPASHPIHEDPASREPPPSAKKKLKASSSKPGSTATGNPVYVYTVAVLLVGGGILYNRYTQQLPPFRNSSSAPVAAQPQPAAPQCKEQAAAAREPEPPLTPEEIAIFEQAAEEHYGLPPGFAMPDELPEEEEQHAEQFEDGRYAVYEPEEMADEEAESEEAGQDWGPAVVSHADKEAQAAATAAFDPKVHRQYLDLPPWPVATEDVLTGSWNFTPSVYDYAAHQPMTQVLSWESPRLMLFPSFLSPEEVGHMVRVSKDNLERSEVLVAEGEETMSNIRTSFGFWPEQDEVIDRITERMHRLTGIPEKFGEGLYVLNYQPGQKYEAHNDHCMDGYVGNTAEPACLDFLKRAGGPQCGHDRGGPTCGDRVATFILYLKSPAKGGQTAFPEADITRQAMGTQHRSGNSPDEWYCEDERVLAAAPAAGTALMFWDYRPGTGAGTGSYEDGSAEANAETVYAAMHAGCPVVEGEKYIATRWIRAAGFDYKLDRVYRQQGQGPPYEEEEAEGEAEADPEGYAEADPEGYAEAEDGWQHDEGEGEDGHEEEL